MAFKARKAKPTEFYVEEINFPKYRKGETVVIFDADILAFKVASVCENKHIFTQKETGEKYLAKSLKEFKGFLEDEKTDIGKKIYKLSQQRLDEDFVWETKHERRLEKLKTMLENCDEFDDFIREDVQTPDPFSYCAETLDNATNKVLEVNKAKKYEMYIGGGENYRSKVPLKLEYKISVRSDGVRPIHLTPAKEFLIKNRGAIKIKGREADDVVQQRAYELAMQGVNVIIYSNDKDRLQGYYAKWYNPDDEKVLVLKDYLGEITRDKKGSGLKWLLFQVSQGDKTDGYSPKDWYSKRYGQVSFFNDFSDTKTPKEFLEKFVDIHKNKLLDKEIYEWDTWDDRHVKSNWLGIIEMMFTCAYMKIATEDNTTFASICKEHGVDVGELIFEVRHVTDVPLEELGCVDEKYK